MGLEKNESERMWTEAVMANLGYCVGVSLEGQRKTMKNSIRMQCFPVPSK
jgi:hypothetical protein